MRCKGIRRTVWHHTVLLPTGKSDRHRGEWWLYQYHSKANRHRDHGLESEFVYLFQSWYKEEAAETHLNPWTLASKTQPGTLPSPSPVIDYVKGLLKFRSNFQSWPWEPLWEREVKGFQKTMISQLHSFGICHSQGRQKSEKAAFTSCQIHVPSQGIISQWGFVKLM